MDGGAVRIDRIVEEARRKAGAVGAALAVVGPGSRVLQRGFGLAAVDSARPADEGTVFRIGSMSKLVTATAVMQLVEEGRLRLDTDVNDELEPDLRIRSIERPITLKHLLTHTAGFEENQLGWMVKRSAAGLAPLGRHLARHKPAQVRAPTSDFRDGRGAAYSNWGMALAGHVVARRSAMPFDDYVDRRVFGPLGMRRSTFREPLPEPLAGALAKGYLLDADGTPAEQGFEYFHCVGPAGSMSTTAADMALFMRAHLQLGPAVLKRRTLRFMQSRILDPHPRVNGAGLGFYEIDLRGRRAIGHQGATLGFTAELVLLPDEQLGVFIVVNTRIAPRRLHALVTALVESLRPGCAVAAAPRPSTPLDRYVGSYLATPHSHRQPEKFLLLALPAYEMRVEATAGGTLRISNLAGPREWFEIAPAVFRQEGSLETVAFASDPSGTVTHLLGPHPFAPAYKLEPEGSPQFHRNLIAVATAGFHLALAWRRQAEGSQGASPELPPALVVAASIAALSLTGLALVGESLAQGAIGFVYEDPESFRLGRRMLSLASGLMPALSALALRAGVLEAWTPDEREGFAAFTALAALFFRSLQRWNLVQPPAG